VGKARGHCEAIQVEKIKEIQVFWERKKRTLRTGLRKLGGAKGEVLEGKVDEPRIVRQKMFSKRAYRGLAIDGERE